VRAVASAADADTLGAMLEGDGLDSDDERMFEDYRRRRLAEMRAEEKRGRFGTMEPLGREDFVRQVTEGSKEGPDGKIEPDSEEEGKGSDSEDEAGPALVRARKLKGTGVVVFLFKDS
jgi:hypothetical protein